MDIPIAMAIDVTVFLVCRPFLHPISNRSFWLTILNFNAIALIARIVIDQFMDQQHWDRLEQNGYDAILSIFVFVIPAIILVIFGMAWLTRGCWRR